jgi:hypothetical protein
MWQRHRVWFISIGIAAVIAVLVVVTELPGGRPS